MIILVFIIIISLIIIIIIVIIIIIIITCDGGSEEKPDDDEYPSVGAKAVLAVCLDPRRTKHYDYGDDFGRILTPRIGLSLSCSVTLRGPLANTLSNGEHTIHRLTHYPKANT